MAIARPSRHRSGKFTESNVQARREVLYAYPNNVYFGVIPDGGRPSFADRPAA